MLIGNTCPPLWMNDNQMMITQSCLILVLVAFMLYMVPLVKGMNKTNWGIDSILKALHNLFDKSLAKREYFSKTTKTDVFPLQFCGHRWLEDKKVADRALEIWSHITTYISEILKKLKHKIPATSSL